jgi:RNA polymerase sigma-70 factor (ECF subfamily)
MAIRLDEAMLAGALRGDKAALGKILEELRAPLFVTCFRMLCNQEDAAEAVQETMIKVIEHVHEFRNASMLTTWVTRIAMNQSISMLRKRKVRRTISLEAELGGAGGGRSGDRGLTLREELQDGKEPTPAQSVQLSESAERVRLALSQLEEDFRQVLVLRDMEGMDYQEVAEVLGVPVGTVKSRLFRARSAMREKLEKLDMGAHYLRTESDSVRARKP